MDQWFYACFGLHQEKKRNWFSLIENINEFFSYLLSVEIDQLAFWNLHLLMIRTRIACVWCPIAFLSLESCPFVQQLDHLEQQPKN